VCVLAVPSRREAQAAVDHASLDALPSGKAQLAASLFGDDPAPARRGPRRASPMPVLRGDSQMPVISEGGIQNCMLLAKEHGMLKPSRALCFSIMAE